MALKCPHSAPERKKENKCQLQLPLHEDPVFPQHPSGSRSVICFRNLFFLSLVAYVRFIVYEHSSRVDSQLSIRMETYGGTDNPESFYICLSNTFCEFSLGGYLPANALLELILK